MFVDEGIYLFFDNEMAAQGTFFLEEIFLSDKFAQEFRKQYMRCGEADALDEQAPELRPLGERKFMEYCGKSKLALFTCTRTLLDLELGLAGDEELVDGFRGIISKESFLFVAEIWDANYFWTGTSIKRWFRARFPLKPKQVKYAKPATVMDLLYEFLESVPGSGDNLLTLKKTLLVLSAEDRSFVEDILRGKNPRNSAKAQDTSARILRALKGTKERIT
jgi:hypothetical protein